MNKVFLFLTILLGFIQGSIATHIVGGEVTYEHLGKNLFDIHFSLFIDCRNGNPEAIKSDKNMFMAVFDGSTNKYLSQYSKNIPWHKLKKIEKINYLCYKAVPHACVDFYSYTAANIYLPPKPGGYIISFQRCCRNNTISNLFNAGKTGSNFWTTLSNKSKRSTNSSAVFKQLPPNFLCMGAPLSFDHSATDKDGDSLVYELFNPFAAATANAPKPSGSSVDKPPFKKVVFRNPYSFSNPMPGKPPISINPKTGLLFVTPTKIGQYVVGILVKEYRNGILVGTTRRDYQFNVQSCPNVVAANFYTDRIHCTNKVDFENKSSKSTSYTWIFDNGDPKIVHTNKQNISKMLNPGKYVVKLVATNPICSDTFTRTFEIKDSIKFELGNDTILCKNQTVTFSPKNMTPHKGKYRWSNFTNTKKITVKKAGQYVLTINDGYCNWRDTINLNYDKKDAFLPPDSIFCQDETVNLALEIKGNYNRFEWNTGETTSKITATKAGIYFVDFYRPQPLGCKYTESINVEQIFIPPFEIPDTILCPSLELDINIDVGAERYLWNDGLTNPKRTLKQAGKYNLKAYKNRCFVEDNFELKYHKVDLELGSDIIACGIVNKTFTLNPSYKSIIWQDGSTNSIYKTTTSGLKKVKIVTKDGCTAEDSVLIQLFPLPVLNLGNDTTICIASPLKLDAGKHYQYLWHTGWTKRFLKTNLEGLYSVTVTDEIGCKKSDTLKILKDKFALPSKLYFANAFTPNRDGNNELFPNNQFKGLEGDYRFQILNRWGQKVFDTNNPYSNWDGSYKGKMVKGGVYIYLVHWVGCDGKYRTAKGNLTVLY